MSSMIFSGYDQFQVANPPAPKFAAFREALDKSEREPRTYARSVGVAVTYWTEEPSAMPLTAHRTYQTIVRAREVEVPLVLASVHDLIPVGAYDDTRDRQVFADGRGRTVVLQPGQFLVVGLDQAWAFASAPEGSVDVFRLTVDGPAIRPLEVAL